jgi:DNA-binding FadR family transcriptional regulator
VRRASDIILSVDKRTVKDRISDRLMSLIASGVLEVGEELPSERELATMLSVSRETIRGAIQTLAARGIVEVAQGTRTRVANAQLGALEMGISSPDAINRYDLEAVHAARLLVELQVVAEAARRITDATLARLEASLAAQREVLDDPVGFLICDREFHVEVYGAGPNPLLGDFVTGLYTYLMDQRRAAVSRSGAIAQSYADHLAIFAALTARDAEATAAAFREHLERIYRTTQSILDRPAGNDGRRIEPPRRAARGR